MKSNIAKIVSIILKIIFIGGIILLPFIPKLYDLVIFNNLIPFKDQTIFYQIAFYLCYILSLSIIFILIIIFNNVYLDPFKPLIVKSLKAIAVIFMILSIIIIIKSFFIPTIISIAIALITFVVSLSFYVLSQIYKVAIEYKKEIDYTI